MILEQLNQSHNKLNGVAKKMKKKNWQNVMAKVYEVILIYTLFLFMNFYKMLRRLALAGPGHALSYLA